MWTRLVVFKIIACKIMSVFFFFFGGGTLCIYVYMEVNNVNHHLKVLMKIY